MMSTIPLRRNASVSFLWLFFSHLNILRLNLDLVAVVVMKVNSTNYALIKLVADKLCYRPIVSTER